MPMLQAGMERGPRQSGFVFRDALLPPLACAFFCSWARGLQGASAPVTCCSAGRQSLAFSSGFQPLPADGMTWDYLATTQPGWRFSMPQAGGFIPMKQSPVPHESKRRFLTTGRQTAESTTADDQIAAWLTRTLGEVDRAGSLQAKMMFRS